jgi:hypothetical protein
MLFRLYGGFTLPPWSHFQSRLVNQSGRIVGRIEARDTVKRRVIIATLSVAAWDPSSTIGHGS